jgi:hypothetical protein
MKIATAYLVGVYGLLLLGLWWCFELCLAELYQDALHASLFLALALWVWRDAYRFVAEHVDEGDDHATD